MYDIYNSDFKTNSFYFKNYINLDLNQQQEILDNRNSVEIRKWMTNQDDISLDTHLRFINGLKNCKTKLYYACFYNDKMIGSFCLNPFSEGQSGEIGSYLFPQWQGQGIGLKAKSEFCQFFLAGAIVDCIFAKTRLNNYKNIHVNEKIGFKKYDSNDEYIYMKLDNKTHLDI